MRAKMHRAALSNTLLPHRALESIFDDDNYVEVDEQWLRAARNKDDQNYHQDDQQTSEPNQSNDDRTNNGQRPIHNNQSA
jgi:hypothetical protein